MHMQAQRGGEGVDAAHSQPGTRRRWVLSIKLRRLWEILGTHWVVLGTSLDITENLAPKGIRSLDR